MLFFLGVRERERPDAHSRKRRGPCRHGRRVLNLASAADDPTRDAAKKRSTAKARVRAFDDGLELVLELRRDKQEREIGNRAVKRREGSTERVFRRRESGATSRDPGTDAKIG